MGKMKGMVVTAVTKSEVTAGTNDRVYLGIVGKGGGCEFPLDILNVTDFPVGGRTKYRFGDVWETAALTGARAAFEADGKNDPEGRGIDLDQVDYVYLRKGGTRLGTEDDEWRVDEVEALLYGASGEKRTFLRKEDTWIGNEFGQQLWLSEKRQFLYATQGDSSAVSAIDISRSRPELAQTIEIGCRPGYLALSPSKARLYVAAPELGQLVVVNTTTSPMAVAARVPLGVNPQEIAIRPDGRRAFVWCEGGILKVVDVSATPPAVIASVTLPGSGSSAGSPARGNLAVSPDGTRLFAIRGSTFSVLNVSGTTPAPVATLPVSDPYDVFMNPARPHAYVYADIGEFYIFDAAATPPRQIGNFGPHQSDAAHWTISGDGSRVLIGAVPGSDEYWLYDTQPFPPALIANWHYMGDDDPPGVGNWTLNQYGKRLYVANYRALHVLDVTVKPAARLAKVPFDQLGGLVL